MNWNIVGAMGEWAGALAVGVLKSLLDAPGGRHWLDNMGGAEMLTDEAKNLMSGTIALQPAIALNQRGA
jgi:hypothetical protein